MLPVVLVILSALGAAGLYLAMPGGRRRKLARLGLLLVIAIGVAVLGIIMPRLVGGATRGWFAVLAAVGLYGAVRMITHRRPVYSALYFILVIVSVTGLLLLMQAEFLAAALLIIYVGAILVTYVFVIMLAQQGGPTPYDSEAREPIFGCIAGFLVLGVVVARLFAGPGESVEPVGSAAAGTVLAIGSQLLTNYVIAIQIAGVLLLAAMVGAVAIARRKAESAQGEID